MGTNQRQLHSLLEAVNDVHKKDIKDVVEGYLNENKLCREQLSEKKVIWKGSKRPPLWLRPKTDLYNHEIKKNILPALDRNVTKMKNSMSDFITTPNVSVANNTTKLKNSQSKSKNTDTSEADSVRKIKLKDYPSTSILPDVMLPSIRGEFKDELITMVQEFIPTYLLQPTKKDQYVHQQRTRKRLVNANGIEKKVTVEEIERKLRKKLEQLEVNPGLRGLNFRRLKVYSEAWDELCTASDTYGDLLHEAKIDYDAYIDSLIDQQLSKTTGALKVQLHAMVSGDSDKETVRQAEREVKVLEEEVLEALQENEKLRNELKNVTATKEKVLSRFVSDYDADEKKQEERDLQYQVESLHAQIEIQLNELEKLKKSRKEDYVPSAVYHRLENCIKETEIDTQKLCKQNQLLEKNIAALEEELENVLIKTGIKPKKNPRLLWRNVTASKVLDVIED